MSNVYEREYSSFCYSSETQLIFHKFLNDTSTSSSHNSHARHNKSYEMYYLRTISTSQEILTGIFHVDSIFTRWISNDNDLFIFFPTEKSSATCNDRNEKLDVEIAQKLRDRLPIASNFEKSANLSSSIFFKFMGQHVMRNPSAIQKKKIKRVRFDVRVHVLLKKFPWLLNFRWNFWP